MKFHLDEHVDPAVASALERRGIDVTTTAQAGLRGAEDEDQLQFADSDGRVFVTNDADFLRLHAAGAKHAGIAYYADQDRSVGGLVGLLLLMHELVRDDEMRMRVEFL